VVALVLLAGCGAGCAKAGTDGGARAAGKGAGGGGGGGGSAVSTTVGTATPIVGTAGGTTATTGATSATTATPGHSATTAAPAAPAANAPPVRPPNPGTYSYATSGAYTYGGRDHALPPHTTLVVDKANGTSQHAARNLRDVDGNGPVVATVLRYEADGLYLDQLSETNRIDGVDDTRQYRPSPPALIAPRTADVGFAAHFDGTDGGTNVHVDSTIERRDTVTVDGTPVDCYVVHAVTTFHGTIEGTGDATSCVSLAYRLLLTESVSTHFTIGPSDVRGAYHAVLEHLTPSAT
jgi:hypothetical protein